MAEIYNETLRDLLVPSGSPAKVLDVREDADGTVAVPGLSEHEPKNAAEVLDLLAQGNRYDIRQDKKNKKRKAHLYLFIYLLATEQSPQPT